jgi:hypothetical protein
VTALFIILASWIVLGAALLGLGLLVLHFVSSEAPDLWRAFWVGFAVAIALLQVWHIAAPVDGRAFMLCGALAAAGVAVARPWRRIPHAKLDVRLGLLLAAATLWLADRSLGPPVGDAGLYHLSAVRWASEHALVPGIANLHYRLGFNNPSLLWTAFADLGGFGANVSISLLLVAVTLRGIVGLTRLTRSGASPADAYWALLLAPVVGQAVTLHELRISSPDPDTAMALVAMAAGGEFVHAIFRPTRSGAFAAATLGVLAACLKLAAAPFAAVLLALVVLRGQAPLVAIALAIVSLVVPWIIRSVVMTGYPLYPLAIGGLPVDWRIPASRVEWVAALVRDHFMPPVAWELSAGGPWLRGWLLWQLTRCAELILVPALAAIAMLRFVRPHRALWLLLACAASLALWLRTPAPRFGYAFAWISVAALGVAILARDGSAESLRRRLRIAAIALAVLPVAHRLAAWTAAGSWSGVTETLLLRPAGSPGFQPVPKADLAIFTTRSGLVVWVPRDGDQVWNAPLPATPEPLPDLALRRPPSLEAGFVLRPDERQSSGVTP